MENFVFPNENSTIDEQFLHALKISESTASCLFSLKTSGNTLFFFHTTAKSWVKLKPTYVEAQGPQCFDKVPYVKFGTANLDIHRVSHGGIKATRVIKIIRSQF